MSSRTPNSVMYDLRGNSGGDVSFANSMVQLFKPDFQPFDPNVDPYAKAWQETERKAVASPMFFSLTRWSLQTPLARPMSALWESSMMEGATLPVKYSLVASRDTVLEPSLEKTKQTGGGGATVVKLDPLSSMLPLQTSKSSHSARSSPVVL
ncbi:hypothetical protein BASA62_007893 [Batrachochytrium salamandrivorans]|nr:hypothetical protein BASA62_007893 [Batrachochytrium salamandrivorans]